MKRKLLLFCLFSIAFSGKIKAQIAPVDTSVQIFPYRNSFYIELGGNAMVGSFNYERIVDLPNNGTKLAFRLGGIFIPVIGILGGTTTHEVFVPAEISLICGKKAFRPEFGAGFTYNWSSGEHVIYSDRYEAAGSGMVFSVLRAGIRWQPSEKPYFIRAAFTPLFFGKMATNSGIPFMQNYGVSFGKSY